MKKIITEMEALRKIRTEKMHWNTNAVSRLMGGLLPLEQQGFEEKAMENSHERREK